MKFPDTRMMRLRRSPALRALVRETSLSAGNLVLPVFACAGVKRREEVVAMPGVARMSTDLLVGSCREAWDAGVRAVLVFGTPDAEDKDESGSIACNGDGVAQSAVRALKKAFPGMLVISDVCLCAYTTHGHCGVLAGTGVENDASLELLARQALSHAKAGADLVAPSDMMDGRVGRIRSELDAHGFSHLPIMSYSAKYASAFYGPFREAAKSAPAFGDRRGYQMDPANSDEALREVALDIEEGADIVMIKPALSYLDIIRRVKDRFNVPLAAYNVSGEYAMLKAAAEKGWVDGEQAMMEILLSIRRAGADIIITYHAIEAARLLQKGS